MSNRKAFEDEVLKWIPQIVPGNENKELYIKLFASMDDKEFDKFVNDLENGNKRLSVVCPNFSKNKISLERNIEIGKKLGHNFFKRIWIPAKGNLPSYLTPIKYMVVTLPITRQAQVLDKKISVPQDSNTVDNRSGQPSGKSLSSSMSYHEAQVLAAFNQEESLLELLKFRGGDEKGYRAMNTSISRTGKVSLRAIEPYSGEVRSTTALRSILTAMHIKSTL